jgi:hypothetical protein
MKKLAILLCTFILTQLVSSQSLIVDDSVKLKKGIYKTYKEFKYNSPSVPLEYEVKWGLFHYTGLSLTPHDTVYQLTIDKAKTKEIGTIWGFCDGNNIYINREFSIITGKVIFEPNSKFFKLLLIDRYCYFISAFPGGNTYLHLCCAIDFNSGEILGLNYKILGKIISKDEELVQEFNAEKSNRDTYEKMDSIYYKYLQLYSKRQKDEIKRE